MRFWRWWCSVQPAGSCGYGPRFSQQIRAGLQACCDRHELGLGRDILSSIGLGRAMGLMCYARVGLMLETWANWIVDCTVQTVTRCTLTVHSAGSMNVACQNCRPHWWATERQTIRYIYSMVELSASLELGHHRGAGSTLGHSLQKLLRSKCRLKLDWFFKHHACGHLVLYIMFVTVRVKPCYQLKLLLLIDQNNWEVSMQISSVDSSILWTYNESKCCIYATAMISKDVW